jgi:hypothetical protein
MLPSNGEVEGPPRSAHQAPWAHTVFPRPRRATTSRSRTQRLLGGGRRRGAVPCMSRPTVPCFDNSGFKEADQIARLAFR